MEAASFLKFSLDLSNDKILKRYSGQRVKAQKKSIQK